MSSNALMQILNSIANSILTRSVLTIIRTIFGCLISFIVVHVPRVSHYVVTLGKYDEKIEKQKRIRAKLTNNNDPSSPYRAVQVLEQLETQLEKKVETLAVIPELCLKRYSNKETMGVREVLDVEDEKQPNGKIYRKVCFLILIIIICLKTRIFSSS